MNLSGFMRTRFFCLILVAALGRAVLRAGHSELRPHRRRRDKSISSRSGVEALYLDLRFRSPFKEVSDHIH